MSRVLPYPLLTLCLTLMWLMLNSFTVGHLLLGTVVALGASWSMAALQPEVLRIKRPGAALRLLGIVFVDMLRSNLAVGLIILTRVNTRRESNFIIIPLALKDRTALSVLAAILTATPGTAWIEFDPARRTLLLHVLDLVDEQVWIDLIKNRYERLLMEIFE